MSCFKISLTKEFFKLKIPIILIGIILEVYYKYLIVPEYPNYSYPLDFNLWKYIIAKLGFVFLLLLSYFLYNRSKFLYAIYLLLIFFFYIPNSIIFSYGNAAYGPFFANLFFVSSFIMSAFVKFNFPVITVSNKYKEIILVAISIVFLIPIIYTFKSDVNFKTLILKDVYETRELFSDKLKGILSYLYHLSVKTILPISLIFFMIRKKYVLVGLYFLILIYLFVISGNKFVYFTSVLLIYFYYIGKDYVSKINYFFLIALGLFLLFPILDYGVIQVEKPILSGTFVNRFLFIPALLTQWYFDFFEGKPFYFAESHLFNQVVNSPYDMPVGFLISKVYLHTTDAYANNGIVSDGFMNLGYIGVLLYSVMFSVVFGIFNSLNLNKGYFGLFFSIIYMILSVQFLSCFITGGILIFFILAVFLLRDNEQIQN